MFLLPIYVAKKYNPYITPIITAVTITEGNNSFGDANVASIDNTNLIPNIECIIAKTNGNMKNMNICLNKA